MKKLLPFVFSGILCLTACGDEEEAAKKQATPATKEIAVEQQTEKAVVEQQDEKAEVNYTLPYSEQNFMAEFIEDYLRAKRCDSKLNRTRYYNGAELLLC